MLKPRRPIYEPKKLPSQARAKETVRAIFEASREILERDGFAGLSTTRVAKRAGVSIGTFYQYFPNKESLVAAVINNVCVEELGVAEAVLEKHAAASVKEKLKHVITAIFAYHAAYPTYQKVVTEEIYRVGDEGKIHEYELYGVELIRQLLESHAAEVDRKNLELAAFIIVYTIENLIRSALMVKPELLPDPDFVNEVVTLINRYLRTAAE